MTAIEFLDSFEGIPLTLAEKIKQSAGKSTEAGRRKAWEQALASARLEGFEPDADYLADVERNITGALSDSDFEAKYTARHIKPAQL